MALPGTWAFLKSRAGVTHFSSTWGDEAVSGTGVLLRKLCMNSAKFLGNPPLTSSSVAPADFHLHVFVFPLPISSAPTVYPPFFSETFLSCLSSSSFFRFSSSLSWFLRSCSFSSSFFASPPPSGYALASFELLHGDAPPFVVASPPPFQLFLLPFGFDGFLLSSTFQSPWTSVLLELVLTLLNLRPWWSVTLNETKNVTLHIDALLLKKTNAMSFYGIYKLSTKRKVSLKV